MLKVYLKVKFKAQDKYFMKTQLGLCSGLNESADRRLYGPKGHSVQEVSPCTSKVFVSIPKIL